MEAINSDGSFNVKYNFFDIPREYFKICGLNIVNVRYGNCIDDHKSADIIRQSLGVAHLWEGDKCNSFRCKRFPKNGFTCEECLQEINSVKYFDNKTRKIRVYKNMIGMYNHLGIIICERFIISPAEYLRYSLPHWLDSLINKIKNVLIVKYTIFSHLGHLPTEINQEIFMLIIESP